MSGDEIRAAFLRFFEEKGHKVIPSSSLIPQGDPTLLLTSAGMVPFKPYFLGEALPPSPRLASAQKCFRATDISSVGDPSHLTFFEMLGNFSVGDYFKREAISWAWEFVTRRLGIPPERLWITIFLDDDEAFGFWREVGIPENRIARFGEEENFWGPAGDSGPCGPSSEIHYDFGEGVGCGENTCAPNCDCGRFSEIWNLVFMQYNQDREGRRTLLPKPNIDTGMGLERTAAVVQGKTSVYETDLFASLLDNISTYIGKKYGSDDEVDKAMRVVVEHGRALTFLIADGVLPSNEGRGYVLRRLLRRAQYFSESLARDKPLLANVAKEVIANMQHVYPELAKNRKHILSVIESEVENFQGTLLLGSARLDKPLIAFRKELVDYFPKFKNAFREALSEQDIVELSGRVEAAVDHFLRDCRAWEHYLRVAGRDAVEEALKPIEDGLEALKRATSRYDGTQPRAFVSLKQHLQGIFEDISTNVKSIATKLSGYEVFILYDTYGLPVEITKEIAAEHGLSIDLEGFGKEMEKQRARARTAQKLDSGRIEVGVIRLTLPKLEFVGYHTLKHKSKIISLLVDNKSVEKIRQGQEASLILESTPFYGEMGGQVGDTGEIIGPSGKFLVTNAIQLPSNITIHQGHIAEGSFKVSDEIGAEVDKERRLDICRNHTATHLLQFALRQVLGEHVQQRGSLVAPDRLRFDFSHLAAVTKEEIGEVQRIVNEKIRQNLKVYDEEIPYKTAIEEGAIALFDEKYGDVVRVLKISRPAVSVELCGGTHVALTGEIGFFHIITETSIGAGLRRIEAVTGRGAEEFLERRLSALTNMANRLATEDENISDKVDSLITERDQERKRSEALERELAKIRAESLASQTEVINGVRVLAAKVPPSRLETLRDMADILRERLKSVIIVLGTVYQDKPVFIAVVTPDLVEKGYNASEIVERVAADTGGGGGGKASFAQGSGKFKDRLDGAIKLVKGLIHSS